MTERNNRTNRRGTDRARAITAMKKRKAARNRKIVIGTVAATLAIAIIAGVSVLGVMLVNNNSHQMTAPATVTKLSMTAPTDQAGTATQAPAKTDNTPAKTDSAPAANTSNTAVSDTNTNTNTTANTNTNTNTAQQTQPTEAAKSADKGYSGGVSADGIIYDQRHEVPKGAGTPLHYYATGKTSGGYDWDYSADNGNISVCCNYNTANNQYDFIIYGKAQGVAHLTLYYYTSDTVRVPVSMTINVDKDLNVTQA